MTNFDFLKDEPQFNSFADAAIAAEQVINIDSGTCAINCRRAMEFAVKWMYSVDDSLEMPYQDKLHSLINSEDFRDIVGFDLWKRIDLIRKVGNRAVHTNKKISYDEAVLCLKNLHIFLDFVSYCYSENYQEHKFNSNLLKNSISTKEDVPEISSVDLQKLIAENKKLREKLTEYRLAKQETYVPPDIMALTESETRKTYIDEMLREAGWL